MKWVTRQRVKIDRVASPWLIRKFVDPEAEFLFVPAEEVMATARQEGAIPFDVPGVELGHHGKECSFDSIVKKHRLAGDSGAPPPGQDRQRRRHGQQPLEPARIGRLGGNRGGIPAPWIRESDHGILAAESIVYDALYAYCREMVSQGKPNGAFR